MAQPSVIYYTEFLLLSWLLFFSSLECVSGCSPADGASGYADKVDWVFDVTDNLTIDAVASVEIKISTGCINGFDWPIMSSSFGKLGDPDISGSRDGTNVPSFTYDLITSTRYPGMVLAGVDLGGLADDRLKMKITYSIDDYLCNRDGRVGIQADWATGRARIYNTLTSSLTFNIRFPTTWAVTSTGFTPSNGITDNGIDQGKQVYNISYNANTLKTTDENGVTVGEVWAFTFLSNTVSPGSLPDCPDLGEKKEEEIDFLLLFLVPVIVLASLVAAIMVYNRFHGNQFEGPNFLSGGLTTYPGSRDIVLSPIENRDRAVTAVVDDYDEGLNDIQGVTRIMVDIELPEETESNAGVADDDVDDAVADNDNDNDVKEENDDLKKETGPEHSI